MGHCYNSTIVNAPVETAWETVRNFHDMSWAQGVITSLDPVGDISGEQEGARRVLNEVFHETLLSLDDEALCLQYSIDQGPGPMEAGALTSYTGILALSPVTDTGQTFVEWGSEFESDDDDGVQEFCDPIYQALLGALKNHFA